MAATTRIALDSNDIETIIYCLETLDAPTYVWPEQLKHKKELIKKLQLAKFKLENEITVAYKKTGRKPTNAQELLEAFDETEFLKEIEAIQESKITGKQQQQD